MISTKDSTQSFSGLADRYTIGRPMYADELIKTLYSEYRFSEQSIIADIGCGTGKFAQQLLEKGSLVYGVEPNDDMRNTAVAELKQYKKFRAVKGTAADTTLKDGSVDNVTVAQAFHWFHVMEFKKECERILQKGGQAFLIWNIRDMLHAVNQKSYEIYSKYCPAFQGFGGGIQKDDWRIKQFFDRKYEYREFANPLVYDKEGFISRSLSASYSLKQNDRDYEKYLDELSCLFEQYAENGMLTMENKTIVYIGKI